MTTKGADSTAGVLDLIGDTPLVELTRIERPGKARLFAKLELTNPTGSLKDRVMKHIIQRAEAAGRLRPGMVVVEATSGNAGISLGMVAAVKGYGSIVYMQKCRSVERRTLMRMWGVDLRLEEGDPHAHIHAAEAHAAGDPDRYYYTYQNGNPWNAEAHYVGTGPEILRQLGGLPLHAFVAGFGTGGTVVGVGRRLREEVPDALVVSVEPDTSDSQIEGMMLLDGSYVPPIWDASVPDRVLRVADQEAMEQSRMLARMEGLFVGPSSGAVCAAGLRIARELGEGNVVLVFADRGERYLSTALCAGLGGCG
jgi:cysteine synthase